MKSASLQPSQWLRYLLPLLLLLSGFCGISYEILYAKLLGNLLGSQFTINATVLLTFLLGFGLGTLHAHRFRPYLWAIEAGIGLYAAIMALGYPALEKLLFEGLPFLGANDYTVAAAAFVLLLVPAFGIGCSIPLFASYLAVLRKTSVFSLTYAIYNVGAALTALSMEFLLLRVVGLRAAIIVLALVNAVVAIGLLVSMRRPLLTAPSPSGAIRFPRRVLIALGVASIASAVLQLAMIKLGEFIFGPYNETFALVLATVLLGLAVGSLAASRLRWSFHHALLLAIGGIGLLLALLPRALELYAFLYPVVAPAYPLLVLLKLSLVIAVLGLPAIGFGATIPALLATHQHVARESGQLLFWSSMGNVVGFVLMAFFLHRVLDYGPILVLVAALAGLAVLVEKRWALHRVSLAAALVVLTLFAAHTFWNESLLYLGHTKLYSLKAFRSTQEYLTFEELFKGGQDVFAITRRRGKPFFFINGYVSIPLDNPDEKLAGGISAMLSPRDDRALVLGLGSGATAGTIGLLFDRTDVVEINKIVIDNQWRMTDYNFDIPSLPGVRLIHDDGIKFIRTSSDQYSLILNTVTTPLYFSSSKLYTRDFLRLVRRRLTPDGIYVTWIDGRVGDRGLNIILTTLKEVFEHCTISYVKSSYQLLVCSPVPVGLKSYDSVLANKTYRKDLAVRYDIPISALPYGVIAVDALALREPGPFRINTLDFPALEHEMARLHRALMNLRGYRERLSEKIDLDTVRDTLGEFMDWRLEEFAFFSDLRLREDSSMKELLDAEIGETLSEHREAYDRAVLNYAESLGTGEGYYEYGKILEELERHEAASTAFAKALALVPERDNIRRHLGRAQHQLGRYDEAVESYLQEWDLDRDSEVPLRIGRALIELGRYREAVDWLDTALTVDDDSDRDDVAFYRGMAYEGLKQLGQARSSYGLALAFDSDDPKTLDALERLDGASPEPGS